MTILSPDCASLKITRSYLQSPASVWEAFADHEKKKRWFKIPTEGTEVVRTMDFRPGGEEHWVVDWASGLRTEYHARYSFIAPGRRMTYTYDLIHSGGLFSVSLADITLSPTADGGTELVMMEALAYHADGDRAKMHESRIHGTSQHFENLAEALASVPA